ncbi:hypothetical protein F3Y22_tig00001674pilonHSYRG00062 [Hibiscus syriacus]|uniref:Uncharacterized protein n=1 Tax=Hibiscus syriacus TaxID=106335 RepID=A0A6A3CZQ3_HIBSY|nr:hypothetical protein F3Y22_tig00001674pilonHSYRG00062 [Hibiscus syriacus]
MRSRNRWSLHRAGRLSSAVTAVHRRRRRERKASFETPFHPEHGSEIRVLKAVAKGLKKSGGGGVVEFERAMKLGRGFYGKVIKIQAMKTLLQMEFRIKAIS